LLSVIAVDLTKRDLDAEAEEALEAARSMPNGPEKIDGSLEKGWTATQGGRCQRDFIREAWQAT
jgi:hypothetical protein